MGVTGLWRLIEPAGKPVPVETLENKVLAVDISIWLHQVVKGYQDARGASLPNAHLMGLFQRLCKLLYFRIKPVFVFDGGFPELKRETIAKRQDSKYKYNTESERLKRELALLLGKKAAINGLLNKQTTSKKNSSGETSKNDDDLFKLPALPQKQEDSDLESDDDHSSSSGSIIDLHSVDIESNEFKSLSAKEKYDLLLELKETRKMNSWGRLHELPKKSDNFSSFQMQRLLKRRKVQECLEETEKEMGDGSMSLNELESLLNETGIDTKIDYLPTRRIASNENTRFLLINNLKQALVSAKKNKEMEEYQTNISEDKNLTITETKKEQADNNENKSIVGNDSEEELKKAIKMSLECGTEADMNTSNPKTDESWSSFTTETDYSSTDTEHDVFEAPDNMSSAKAYIMQYSDFTHKAINNIVNLEKKSAKNQTNITNIDRILKELDGEQPVISMNDGDLRNETAHEIQEKQSSVICVPKTNNIESLDCSIESEQWEEGVKVSVNKSSSKEESDSCDDDFIEVNECEQNISKKPIIELTLNVTDVLKDDIFEDIFVSQDATKNVNTQVSIKTDLKIEQSVVEESKDKNDKYQFNQSITSGDIKSQTDKPTDQMKITPIISNKDDKCSITSITTNIKQREEKVTNHEDNIQKKTKKILENLETIADDIDIEEQDLREEKNRLDRIGRNITEQMTQDAQELLQIFGIPYIIAPMEAEAQCAFLENIKLTDGTITDDSDIWLFGGRTVYKNFFNNKKHVLQFLSERIEKSFNLTREQLILLALLVGSDYTPGLTGVGPVTALEILASFPFKKKFNTTETSKQREYEQIAAGLQDFKRWVRSGKRTDNISLKRKLKNIIVTDDFPSVRVIQAYLEPNVEKSEDKFTWGEVDITVLRDYTKAKFGWSQSKLDEIIKPVLKRLLERKNQKTVPDYFKRKIEFQSLNDQMSKRVKAAVEKMGPSEYTKVVETKLSTSKLKQKRKGKNKCVEKQFNEETQAAGPSKVKIIDCLPDQVQESTAKNIEIPVIKTDRVQEIIPQREKYQRNVLKNKMKAIEIYRKNKYEQKKRVIKKKVIVPKEKADLSESSDSS